MRGVRYVDTRASPRRAKADLTVSEKKSIDRQSDAEVASSLLGVTSTSEAALAARSEMLFRERMAPEK